MQGYTFFSQLFFIQNKDCGYSLESHRRRGSNVCPRSKVWKKMLKIHVASVFEGNFYN